MTVYNVKFLKPSIVTKFYPKLDPFDRFNRQIQHTNVKLSLYLILLMIQLTIVVEMYTFVGQISPSPLTDATRQNGSVLFVRTVYFLLLYECGRRGFYSHRNLVVIVSF